MYSCTASLLRTYNLAVELKMMSLHQYLKSTVSLPIPIQALVDQTTPPAAFNSFKINTREGFGGLLILVWIQIICNIYVTWVGCAHTMPRASHFIFVWPFTRTMDLLCDRISHYKVPKACELAVMCSAAVSDSGLETSEAQL